MYPRAADSRWATRFGGWISSYTARALGREVGVHPTAVYRWLRGVDVPRPAIALRIVELSGGRLTLDDIYQGHQRELRAEESRDRK